MNRNLSLLLVFFAAALLAPAAAAGAGEIAWAPLDFEAACRRARTEGKLIHVFVEGDNCPPCDAFKLTHLPDPAYVDYASTLFVNIRAHENDPTAQAFLQRLGLTHAAVPRFYVLDPDGKAVSMSVGMVAAPPMEGVEALAMASGVELPVDRDAAAALAGRLRSHAASLRASGKSHPDNPLRPIGVAALEAQAWALAGRLDEAEKAFGAEWANLLGDRDVMGWYVNFWLAWERNLPGALAAAEALRQAAPEDANAVWLLAAASAANGRYAEAVALAEGLDSSGPDGAVLAGIIAEWRERAGR